MESIGFTCKKNQFFNAKFHVLGLFITLKMNSERKKNPSVTRRCHPVVGRNLYRRYPAVLRALRLRLPFDSWAGLMHLILRIFEILKSLEQTQESKKIKINFDFFVKMLDSLHFGKKMSYTMLYLEFFVRIGNF
jgi:hypothetical protein